MAYEQTSLRKNLKGALNLESEDFYSSFYGSEDSLIEFKRIDEVDEVMDAIKKEEKTI